VRDSAAEHLDEEDVDLGELGSSLGFLLRISQLKAFEGFYEALKDFDFAPGEYTVLWVIALNPGLRQGTIARRLNIKPAHMTKLVQRMVTAGYVLRNIPEDDRRSVHLSLTEAGAETVARTREAFLHHRLTERGALDADEAEQLIALLRKYAGTEGGDI